MKKRAEARSNENWPEGSIHEPTTYRVYIILRRFAMKPIAPSPAISNA